MSRFGQVVYLVGCGLELFFVLPFCFNRRVFDRVWEKYKTADMDKSIFNLCVQWLLYHGDRIGLSYSDINVLIFCIIWPVITLV